MEFLINKVETDFFKCNYCKEVNSNNYILTTNYKKVIICNNCFQNKQINEKYNNYNLLIINNNQSFCKICKSKKVNIKEFIFKDKILIKNLNICIECLKSIKLFINREEIKY